jgi:hypothetical protein
LWDRILGFESLEILPVLAVAILLFKSKALMKTQSIEEVDVSDGK